MKINIKNQKKVEVALDQIQGNCSARIFGYSDILKSVQMAEIELDGLKIPKASRANCRILMCSPRVARSYRYVAQGTYVELERGARDWFVTRISRRPSGSIPHGCSSVNTLVLTEVAIAAMPRTVSIVC